MRRYLLPLAVLTLAGGCTSDDGPLTPPTPATPQPSPSASLSPTDPPVVETAAAMWYVQGDQDINAATEDITVGVTRLGCNGGVTGTPQPPEFEVTPDEIVISFVVTPGEPLGAATCPGDDLVSYTLTLPEPLGERRLVDGQCSTEASSTSFCTPDDVREP